MFAVSVIFHVKSDDYDSFLPLMHKNAAASLANEPDCQVFDVCTDPERPGEVFLYEVYDSEAAFDAHLASAHFLAFDAETASMITDKTVALYREVQR